MDPSIHMMQDFDPATYVQALVALAHIDGLFDIERDYVDAKAQLLGVTPDWSAVSADLQPIGAEVSELTRRVVIRDCIVLASVDGEYSDAERAVVHRIAQWLEVDEAACDRIEDWLRRYWELLDESEALLSGFDAPYENG
jgi:uncharacterized membrane protein YebE (DUF533 family)